MSSGSTKTSTQTTASSPWPESQPYIEDAMQSASNKVENQKGFNPYPGDTYVPFSSQTQSALDTTQALASQPNPFYAGNSAFTQGLVGGDYNLDQSGYQAMAGPSITTEGAYKDLYSQQNPLFNQALDTQASKLTDDIARTFGGASYGSASNTGALVDQVGDLRTQAMSDQFNTEQAFKAGLLGSVSGIQGTNYSNELARQGAMAGLSQTDLQNQLAGVGVADSVYNSQYLPAQQMAQVGASYDAKAAEALQSQIDAFNIQQQAGWNRLGAAWPYYTGTGGSTSTATLSQPTDPWSTILGAGLLGTQALSSGGLFNQSGNLF